MECLLGASDVMHSLSAVFLSAFSLAGLSIVESRVDIPTVILLSISLFRSVNVYILYISFLLC